MSTPAPGRGLGRRARGSRARIRLWTGSFSASTRSNSVQAHIGHVQVAKTGSLAASPVDGHVTRASIRPHCSHFLATAMVGTSGCGAGTPTVGRAGSQAHQSVGARCLAVARHERLSTIASDAASRPDPRPADRGAASRRDPPPVRRVLRRARPHRRAQREPRAGGRSDAAVHELRDGPVQGRLRRCRDPLVHAGGRLPARPARRGQAQRLRGGRAHAPPSHVLRDARQLVVRRLLQARGDPLGLGLPDPGPRHPGRASGRDHLQGRRGGASGLA